jgi:hypothetical protein
LYQVAQPAGRVVTLRLSSPIDDVECARAVDEIRRVLSGVKGRACICTDLTRARTFPPTVAERFGALMKVDNDKIERSGFLIGVDAAATFALQIDRMIREAANPSRRTFRQAADLTTWLGEIVDAVERGAIATFLAQG